MSSSAIEPESPDLVCQLDKVQGVVDALTSVRWKRHQDAVVELSEHGIVLIVEETACLQAKVYLQRELFVRYEYSAEGRPRFGVSLGLFVDCLNTFSVPGHSSAIEICYPGPDMQLLLKSVDSSGACTYAEIRTRIPDTISWDYNFEPAGSTPLSFTVKDMTSRNLQKKATSDEEVPSAPQFCSSAAEIKEDDERVPASRTVNVQCTAEDSGLSTKANSNIHSGLNDQVKVPNHSDSPVRTTAAAVESGGRSGSYPAHLPTFHARLQQVILQSEEELMASRSSELPKEAVAAKPKQMVGKMKIQVRKVKMGLDPPTGCSFSSLKTPELKMESVRYHRSNLRSTFSSGWKAVRKVRFAPRVPANGSILRQSLAYMQASTQYIKQVSGLLKIGVTSLRNSPSSYEVVQETYYCLLRLKSSMEEDAIKMQPGSGETHIFFPDSFRDDLIVEVLDSNGNGRVLAQVATIAKEPVNLSKFYLVINYHNCFS